MLTVNHLSIALEYIESIFAAILNWCVECYKFIVRWVDATVEGENETVEWCRLKLGVNFQCLDDLWQSGARAVSSLLEDESETWRDLQDAAVRKINISPTISPVQLNNPFLEKKERESFVLFLKTIRRFIEKSDYTIEPCLRVSHDLIARGVGLYAAYSSKRAVFYIYSASGEYDAVKVDMKGKAEVKIEKKKRAGRMMVGYTAYFKGHYFLYISKNGWMAPGCPFEIAVNDAPPGYTGNFGAGEWDKPDQPEEEMSSLEISWKCPKSSETMYDSVPRRRKKNKKPKEPKKLSKIVSAIINAKRLFSTHPVPEIKILPPTPVEPEFTVWSSMTEFGVPAQRRRSITYISSEGATFPLSLSNEAKTSVFDTIDNLDIFKNDSDIWAVQNDANKIPQINLLGVESPCWQNDGTSKENTPFGTTRISFDDYEDRFTSLPENSTYKNRRAFLQQTLAESQTNLNEKEEENNQKIFFNNTLQVDKTEERTSGSLSKWNKELQMIKEENTERKEIEIILSFDENEVNNTLHNLNASILGCEESNFSERNNNELEIQKTGENNLTTAFLPIQSDMTLFDNEKLNTQRVDDDGFSQSAFLQFKNFKNKVESFSFETDFNLAPTPLGNFEHDLQHDLIDLHDNNEITSGKEAIESENTVEDGKFEISTPNNEEKYMSSGSSTDGKQSSLPSLDKLETGSEDTSVSEKIIEVAVVEKYECTLQRSASYYKYRRRCRSILSLFDLRRCARKKDLRRTKSAVTRIGGRTSYNPLTCVKNNQKILVTFSEYAKSKEEIKLSQPVKQWKTYWDNLLESKENKYSKANEIELKGVVTKVRAAFDEAPKETPFSGPSDIHAEEGRKKRFEKAKNLFSSLERSFTPSPRPRSKKKESTLENVSRSLERDLKGLFNDINHGIGLPGIPNRLALLASLRSIEPGIPEQSYDPNYPHLPTTPPSAYKSRTSCKDLIPWNQVLSAS